MAAEQPIRYLLRGRAVRARLARLRVQRLADRLGDALLAGRRAVNRSAFLLRGRRPWRGYVEYKKRFIAAALSDDPLMAACREGRPLPPGYGVGLDERVVEYPWVFARLQPGTTFLIDAGSTLNFPYLLRRPEFREKLTVILTLAPEGMVRGASASYLYGDLRGTLLKGGSFDETVYISTLEHVGMDNTRLYTGDGRYAEAGPDSWRHSVRELRRLLAASGQLLLTVPNGQREQLGWQQQFDTLMLTELVESFGAPTEVERMWYRYDTSGWQRASETACVNASYHDPHGATGPASDGAAAARAVACLRITA